MPKLIKPMSEDTVRNAMPKEKQFALFDGGGLHLLVTPSGGKLWRFKYRFHGKEKKLAIGTYPEIGIQDARSNRDASKELLSRGFDPSEIRKREKARDKADRLESARIPSVRATFDGKIEIWKGNNTMRLTLDEARFIGTLLANITR
ncbi:MAG: Arm DNA-binding domain-containing protein [Smithellaceae bacterium]|jgi:hypothetical protein